MAPPVQQGVATILGRREHAARGVGFRLDRAGPLASIRLAIDALTPPKKIQVVWISGWV